MVPIPDDAPRRRTLELARRARAPLRSPREARRLRARARPGAAAPVDGAGDARFRALRPAYLRFTSGTTAERKGVLLGHDAILARLAAANRGLAIGPGDRVLWLLPMAHHFVVSILLYLRYGATILLPAGPSRARCSSSRRASARRVLYASPYHYQLLGEGRVGLAPRRVRLAISTAEGLRAEIARALPRALRHRARRRRSASSRSACPS